MKAKDKEPISQRIFRALDIPAEALPHSTAVEIHGRNLVKIVGGGAITLYSPDEIRISLGHQDEHISVKGYALSCSSYNMGAVGIEGRICSVAFEESCNEG